jgi:hypothetical protein
MLEKWREAAEGPAIESRMFFQTRADESAQLLHIPLSAAYGYNRNRQLAACSQCLQCGIDFLLREIAGAAEQHQRVSRGTHYFSLCDVSA